MTDRMYVGIRKPSLKKAFVQRGFCHVTDLEGKSLKPRETFYTNVKLTEKQDVNLTGFDKTYSVPGNNFDWGYNGALPRNLAISIVDDFFSDVQVEGEGIPEYVARYFANHLMTEVLANPAFSDGESNHTWVLKEDELRAYFGRLYENLEE